jgi:hypothetical protein
MYYILKKENVLQSIDDLKRDGICMTDTGVKKSRAPFAGECK